MTSRERASSWIRLVLIWTLLAAVCASPSSAFELPKGIEIGPPAPAPGDDEPYEITIGQAREALWYKGAYGILSQAFKEAGVDYERLRVAYGDVLGMLKVAHGQVAEAENQRDMWRGIAIVGLAGVGVSLGALVVVALLRWPAP